MTDVAPTMQKLYGKFVTQFSQLEPNMLPVSQIGCDRKKDPLKLIFADFAAKQSLEICAGNLACHTHYSYLHVIIIKL